MNPDEISASLSSEAERLAAMRQDLREAESLDGEPSSGRELNTVDQHPADMASEQQQREVDLSLLEQVEAELVDVERALDKLAQGTYGVCEACGGSIGDERLEVQPAARFCINDQALSENSR